MSTGKNVEKHLDLPMSTSMCPCPCPCPSAHVHVHVHVQISPVKFSRIYYMCTVMSNIFFSSKNNIILNTHFPLHFKPFF